MATKQHMADVIVERVGAGAMSSRKMFGAYLIYGDGKMVALVCDDQLYVKTTKAGRALIGGGIVETSPFKGAKLYLWISGEQWDEAEWLTGLIGPRGLSCRFRP